MPGLVAAVALRIGFALIATQLLAIIGLLLAGGALLLWVCWKMWRELRAAGHQDHAARGANAAAMQPAKSFRDAFLQILAADVSMSLDNVLAVAGAAHEHPAVMVFGLLLSIALMGLAASWIARMLNKHRWIGYIGLFIVLFVALNMMWEGHRTVVIDLGRTGAIQRPHARNRAGHRPGGDRAASEAQDVGRVRARGGCRRADRMQTVRTSQTGG